MTAGEAPRKNQTYTQILKSTMLMGGSSLVNVALSIVRNKTLAVLLGPDGVGLMGVYLSIIEISQAVAGFGVGGSGVRQVAEAAATGDETRIARSAAALRGISIILAITGALLLVALAAPLSTLTFGDQHHAAALALLSLAVFFRLLSAGQTALIQGMRGIGNLARINVYAGFFSTVVSIPLIYLFGEQAIAPCLVVITAISILPTWWYSRHFAAQPSSLTGNQFRKEAAALLRLGVVFMASALLTAAAAYAIRLIVLKAGSVNDAGLYQAAWAIGGLYAGFILQAMGTDFYPRLTAAADDKAECNRLVNEQTEVSILLAGPGLLATLTFAPLIMSVFYSAEFGGGVDLLRWICLGMMLRIVSWPIGFIVIARNAQLPFFLTEVAATLVHVGLAWLCVGQVGVSGAGMAYLGLYAWHSIIIYVIVRRMTGFCWSAANRRHALLFLPVSAMVYAANIVLQPPTAMIIGLVVCVFTGIYSLRTLADLLPPETMPAFIRGWITKSA
jgi:PST family polysaccharide transporter